MYIFSFIRKGDKEKVKVTIPGELKSTILRTSGWNGVDAPVYLEITIKSNYLDLMDKKELENLLWYGILEEIHVYKDDGTLSFDMKVPINFIDLVSAEGDLIITYGNQLYADDAS